MKPFFIAAALSLGLCSCSESAPVVQILQTKLPNAACVVAADSAGLANGSLNLAYGDRYLLAFVVNNSYSSTPIEIGDVPLEPDSTAGGAGTAIVDTLKLSYESTPSLSIPDGEVPYTAGLAPASKGNTLVADLLTTEAAQALSQAVASGGTVQVRVTAQFTGKFASGGNSFETNEVVYAIDAYSANRGIPACTPGQVIPPVIPCNSTGGQDGNYPECI
ncbi:hypothetical protein [Corallococcus caeni]|uniref:Lipoprotein n=1 Tax=Corallococcus caeni TaxID=3082388 RepID=A0ABQ6R1F1_9BACT|nr:hypothetical protein ASNO1_59900 [Corallococcus sp. NO1]